MSALLARLVDDAALLPPGRAPMDEALDAMRAEPRVRPASVRLALPEDADQARAAAVTLARLPSGVPAHIEVRRSPGWRDALDRIAAARAHGAPLGADFRLDGPASATAAFISACAERDVPITCSGPVRSLPTVLLATAQAAAGDGDVQRTLGRRDATGVTADLGSLTGDEAQAARGLLTAFAVPGLGTALSTLDLIRKAPFSTRVG
ncbi:hypothetical protein ACQPZP_06570 [Spirillospora sp. CA-142024]|uniref:hypothetical protein n=1 Tax=Spirillospora sp. CA-142024 TaxID=3240036 RepID=UPI003D9030FA